MTHRKLGRPRKWHAVEVSYVRIHLPRGKTGPCPRSLGRVEPLNLCASGYLQNKQFWPKVEQSEKSSGSGQVPKSLVLRGKRVCTRFPASPSRDRSARTPFVASPDTSRNFLDRELTSQPMAFTTGPPVDLRDMASVVLDAVYC